MTEKTILPAPARARAIGKDQRIREKENAGIEDGPASATISTLGSIHCKKSINGETDAGTRAIVVHEAVAHGQVAGVVNARARQSVTKGGIGSVWCAAVADAQTRKGHHDVGIDSEDPARVVSGDGESRRIWPKEGKAFGNRQLAIG